MDVEQATFVVRHKAWGEDAHEACQHHKVGLVFVDFRHQGGVKGFAGLGLVGEGFVVNDSCRNAVFFGKGQAFGVGFVADDGAHLRVELLGPVLGLRGAHDGGHVGAAARNQDDDVFHCRELSARVDVGLHTRARFEF